jgi:hypothetical protein
LRGRGRGRRLIVAQKGFIANIGILIFRHKLYYKSFVRIFIIPENLHDSGDRRYHHYSAEMLEKYLIDCFLLYKWKNATIKSCQYYFSLKKIDLATKVRKVTRESILKINAAFINR